MKNQIAADFSTKESIDNQSTDNNTLNDRLKGTFQGLFNRSYELELLVAGAFIFLLLRLPSYLDMVEDYSLLKATTSTKFIFVVVLFLKSITYILLLNLLSHFILRCLWVGVIGVASVCQKEEPTVDKNWGIAFQTFKQQNQLTIAQLGTNLDRFCRMLFGLTFGLLILSIGITIQTAIFLSLASALQPKMFPSLSSIQVFLLIYAVVFIPAVLFSQIDKFATKFSFASKIFQSVTWIRLGSLLFHTSRWMNPFVIVSSPIFGALYENVKKRTLIFILIGYYFLFIGLMYAMNMQYRSYIFFPETFAEYGVNYAFYENLRPSDQKFGSPSIQSDIISDKYVKLFIPYRNSDSDSIQKYFPELAPFHEEGFSFDAGEAKTDQLQIALKCFEQFFIVSVNQNPVTNASIQFYKQPKTDLPGVLYYIPTETLPMGRNIIHIVRPYSRGQREYHIPFFK